MKYTQTRMERCTPSTLEFQRYSSHHITSDYISRATKGITNVTMIPKAAVVSKAIVAVLYTPKMVLVLTVAGNM
jgi:hypothetical protein